MSAPKVSVRLADRRGSHSDEHLARGGLRLRYLLEVEHLGRAVSILNDRAHDALSVRDLGRAQPARR